MGAVATIFIVAAVVSTTWCMWVRRTSWSCIWERGATVAIAAIGASTLLSLHPIVGVLDQFLYNTTDVAGQSSWLSNCLTLLGSAALACHLLLRSHYGDQDVGRIFQTRVNYPVTVAISLMYATLSQCGNTRPGVRLDEIPCCHWLMAYWAIFLSTLIYIKCQIVWLLLGIRMDPRSRRCANALMFATVVSIIAATVHVTILPLGFHQDVAHAIRIMVSGIRLFNSAATIALCVTCTASWQAKTAWYRSAAKVLRAG